MGTHLRKLAVLFLVALFSSGLSSCGLLTFSSFLGSNVINNGATSSSAEDLSESETGLFADGPVDIPVSIAKLDSPDSSLIEVSITDITPDESAPLHLTRLRMLTADTEYLFTFTGLAGAVADISATPFILLSNTQTGESIIVAVTSTGAFSAALNGATEQDFILTALTASNLTQAKASPVLIFKADEQGAVLVKTTNSNDLHSDSTIVVDNLGNTYFSNRDIDGTYNFWRRNLNGAQPDLLLSGLVSPIRLVTVYDTISAVYLDEAGNLILASTGTADGNPLVLRRDLFANSDGISDVMGRVISLNQFDLNTFGEDFSDNNDGLPYSLIAIPNKGFLIAKRFANGADDGIDNQSGILEFYDTEGQPITIIPIVENGVTYDDVHVSYDTAEQSLIIAVSQVNQPFYTLYSMGLQGNTVPSAAGWQNRNLIMNGLNNVLSLAANGRRIIYTKMNPQTQRKEFQVIVDGGVGYRIDDFDQQDDPYSDLLQISPDGEYAVMCKLDSSKLYISPLVDGADHTPIEIATSGVCRMKDIVIDAEHRIYFYSTPAPENPAEANSNPPQMTIINLDEIPLIQDAIGQ
jgi:hypothetical protein